MDERRFDLLAKALTEASSRRDALKVTVAGAAAGLFGITLAEDESEAQNRDRDRRNRGGNRRRRGRRRRKFCDCPDNNEKNCVTKTLSKNKAKRLKNKHPNSYNGRCRGGCLSNNTECNTNRPGECCAGLCCLDYTSGTGGICPTDGGNCCGRVDRGGYCPSQAPDCCGTNACCPYESVCCATALDRTGWCCPAGTECGLGTGSCLTPRAAEVGGESVAATTVERVRNS
jgi:hypothetical protein